jgi:hypothetical protein
MKNLLALGMCLFLFHSAQAQSLITFASGDFEGGNISINWTGGGVVTGAFGGENIKVVSDFPDGINLIPTSSENEEISIPTEFVLEQNYPNPFNPSTNISYSIARPSEVSIRIYNSIGALVSSINEGSRAPGNYTVTFNASNLATGMYIYTLSADNQIVSTKKMLLIK